MKSGRGAAGVVIRKDSPRQGRDRRANTPLTTDKRRLAGWKAAHDFVERSLQEAKTEAGGDDLSASKARASMPPLALATLAIGFVTRVKRKRRPPQACPEAVTETVGGVGFRISPGPRCGNWYARSSRSKRVPLRRPVPS